ncbi:GNAT family N-acetyltransferase [Corynebacterium renale]|uniref:GNAT family N-acetyltransferase n=1 Tax=Corynebacterium renale TaxID=1724 RepID=UPI00069E32BD|nr:GNAT family N-acetyltransferase [Corynebacterium renale]
MSKTLSLTSFEKAYVDQATELLTRSFAYDPSFAEIAQLHTEQGDFGVLRELFRAQLTSWGDQAHVDLAFLDDDLVGIATWSEPDALPAMEDIADHMVPIVGQDVWDRMLSGHKEELAYHPKFPHWYLYVIAVDPSAQGHGVGSASSTRGSIAWAATRRTSKHRPTVQRVFISGLISHCWARSPHRTDPLAS